MECVGNWKKSLNWDFSQLQIFDFSGTQRLQLLEAEKNDRQKAHCGRRMVPGLSPRSSEVSKLRSPELLCRSSEVPKLRSPELLRRSSEVPNYTSPKLRSPEVPDFSSEAPKSRSSKVSKSPFSPKLRSPEVPDFFSEAPKSRSPGLFLRSSEVPKSRTFSPKLRSLEVPDFFSEAPKSRSPGLFLRSSEVSKSRTFGPKLRSLEVPNFWAEAPKSRSPELLGRSSEVSVHFEKASSQGYISYSSSSQVPEWVRRFLIFWTLWDSVRAHSATQWTASVHTLHMSKPVITFVFTVLRNGLLPYILYTCPNPW